MTINHKRGDTFEVQCTYKDPTGTPINLDTQGITVHSHIKGTNGESISKLTFIKEDQATKPGQFRLRDSNTKNWKVGKALWDISYVSSQNTTTTDTIELNIVSRQTTVP